MGCAGCTFADATGETVPAKGSDKGAAGPRSPSSSLSGADSGGIAGESEEARTGIENGFSPASVTAIAEPGSDAGALWLEAPC